MIAKWMYPILLAALFASGCVAVHPPFQHRPSYTTAAMARQDANTAAGPIRIKWLPSTFPGRVDAVKAASFGGSAAQTMVPTGMALSQRITELLDIMVGIDDSAADVLTLSIVSSATEIEYINAFAHPTVIMSTLDFGRCKLHINFAWRGDRWTREYTAQLRDTEVTGQRPPTAVLEEVWDDIALQVAQDVVRHIGKS